MSKQAIAVLKSARMQKIRCTPRAGIIDNRAMRCRVKICCISSLDEAALAVRHGASALGLVSAMPSGPGVIGEEAIATIAAAVPPGVDSFLLTSLQDPEAIVEQHGRCRTTTIQLCDALPAGAHRRLRAALPGVRLVQVVHVTGDDALDEARAAADAVDAVLLDSGQPSLTVKQLGGTGRVHDWAVSRRIRDAIKKPLYLAGGLHEGNVAEALRRVDPFGLDLCSSVRANGALDADRLARFMRAVAS
ncbi:MAG TPA: phosphoribosylanthranilate isomerase [Kofleriaceae bacterium]|nr:phosphoribosylanthranilate isomerase [Kofleriaceae bacterium]